jgi:hypothetical protein
MNMENELIKRQSLAQRNRIVRYIGNDKTRFRELVKLFFQGEYRLTQHAAWPLSYCIQNQPDLVKPHLKKFIDKLLDQHAHPAVKRNIIRLFQFIIIPKKYHGRVMDLCFHFINSPGEAIAVKAFSLHILENMSKTYPEIFSELKSVIEARWDFESPAFRSRARKIVKRI